MLFQPKSSRHRKVVHSLRRCALLRPIAEQKFLLRLIDDLSQSFFEKQTVLEQSIGVKSSVKRNKNFRYIFKHELLLYEQF
jgi:hypothetical protein